MSVRYDLSGRCAIVTGGAGGLGRGIARALLAAGASVELWDQDANALTEAVVDLGRRVSRRQLDIRVAGAVEEAAQAAFASHGRIDILVNNAGVLGEVKPIWETSPENFQRVLQVNLFGTYLVTRSVVGLMRQQPPRAPSAGGHPLRGHVVNIASIQGKEGMPMASAYSASKAGMIGFSKSLAQEVGSRGITVNCIAPGFIASPMTDVLNDQQREAILSKIPAGRLGAGDEIASAAVYLSSDEAAYVTGQTLHVNGGMAMI